MATQVTNYQCPACTGALHFVGASGKLECEYCGSSFSVEEIEALYKEPETQQDQQTQQDWDTSQLKEDWGEDGEGMAAYSCPSCGAQLLCEQTTAATSCPYCGNQTVIPGQFSGALKPDYVLPFRLSKEQAVEALKKHYRGKPLLPSAFTEENHIGEIKGIYVPFWLFDGRAQGSVRYHATRVHTHTAGDYEITETDHFDIHRAGSMDFEKVPVDASSKMPDDYMDSIEPYDYSDLKPFSKGYLPGFLADKYDVPMAESGPRADERCRASLEAALADTVTGYATCVPAGKSIQLRRGEVHYALLPVWLLCTQWNGKNYLFAMNGQTGKLVGDLPISWKKLAAWFAALAVPLMAIATAAACLMG